jgi:hypothetical protein
MEAVSHPSRKLRVRTVAGSGNPIRFEILMDALRCAGVFVSAMTGPDGLESPAPHRRGHSVHPGRLSAHYPPSIHRVGLISIFGRVMPRRSESDQACRVASDKTEVFEQSNVILDGVICVFLIGADNLSNFFEGELRISMGAKSSDDRFAQCLVSAHIWDSQ